MSDNHPSNRQRGKPPEPWRIERMVQRVPAHLGEDASFSPWLVVGALAIIILVLALLLFFTGLPSAEVAAPAETRTRTPRPTTIIVITATPPANTVTPTPLPTPLAVQYTVKSGDTLSTIAQKFKVSVDAIKKANNLGSDTIHIGEILQIPQPGATPPALALAVSATPTLSPTPTQLVFITPTLIAFAGTQSPAPQTTPTPTPGVVLYTVKSGDTLLGIAIIFSTTVQSIIDINKLGGPNIRAGQPLTVPIGAWTATPTATIYIQPTATLTPQFTFGAPLLLSPGEGSEFAHDSHITFQWASVGVLAADEYYVVSLRYPNGDSEETVSLNGGQATSYRLDSSPSSSSDPTEFSWYVVVVRGTGCEPASPAAVQPCAISPPSEIRTFTWR